MTDELSTLKAQLAQSEQRERELREQVDILLEGRAELRISSGWKKYNDAFDKLAALRSAPPSTQEQLLKGASNLSHKGEDCAKDQNFAMQNIGAVVQDSAQAPAENSFAVTKGEQSPDGVSREESRRFGNAEPGGGSRVSPPEDSSGTSSIGLERGVSNSEVAGSSPASLTTHCMDCGVEETTEGVDTVLTRDQWQLINPELGGVLCASCIVRRAARLPKVIGTFLYITFASDYDTMVEHEGPEFWRGKTVHPAVISSMCKRCQSGPQDSPSRSEPRKASHKQRRSLILQGDGVFIRDMNGSYAYDGHWPLTKTEELTQRVQRWYQANRFPHPAPKRRSAMSKDGRDYARGPANNVTAGWQSQAATPPRCRVPECGHIEASHFGCAIGSFCEECPTENNIWEHVYDLDRRVSGVHERRGHQHPDGPRARNHWPYSIETRTGPLDRRERK